MEHFFRHHERTVRTLHAAVWILCAASLDSSAFSADKSSQSSPTLDFANGLYARKMYEPAVAEYEKFLKNHPGSPEEASARFRYADSYYFMKDYAAAIAHFDVFLKRFPTDKRSDLAVFRLGTARYNQGDRARAVRSFSGLIRSTRDEAVRSGALFYLAKCLEERGRQERALKIYSEIIRRNPSSEYASYAGVSIGDHHIQAQRLREALEGYRAAAANDEPRELSLQARFKAAEILFSLEEYAEAETYYSKVFDKGAGELKDKALLGLFYCDYHQDHADAAEKRYRATKPSLESNGQKDEILYLIAVIFSEHGRYDEALKVLDEVIASRTVSEELRQKARFKRIAVLSDAGRKEESLKELDGQFAKEASQDKALFEKARLLAEIGKVDEALVAFDRVHREFPASEFADEALYQSGLALVKLGRGADAKKAFRDYAVRFPKGAWADLAELQIVQVDLDAKAYPQAFSAIENFIKDHPKSDKLDIAYYKLGMAAAGLGRFGHASYAFKKVTEEFSSSKLYVEALYGTAASLENAKRLPEAIALYEELLRAYPDHPLAGELRTRLGYLYIQNQDPGKALTFYEEMLFQRSDVPLETDGVFWVIRYLLDQGLYDRLDRILGVLKTRFPERNLDHEIFFFQAESALGAKDYEKAAALYEKAVQASAEGDFAPHAHLGRGIALAVLGRDAEASASFAEALRYDHEIKVAMRARFELANLELKAKRLDEAAKAFMMVAILYDDPKFTPPSLYKAGECFRSLGRTEDAEKAFEELRSKYPQSEWAKRA